MSQQQMNFEEINSDSPKSYAGYEGIFNQNDYNTRSYNQKLSTGQTIKSVYRVLLAIVSLVLWITLLLIMLLGEGLANVSDSSGARLLQPLLVFGFLLLTGFLVTINILLNRRR